ncbi:alpha-L-fucosidase isoform X2 [Diorhabda sublineata]|uniref:alpha-L-fucosidase isoform X2 n=1 Tax=Diorhabda sublineata TaxID=1163346 RepID=UPI0024E14E94|nr:alpha-L-fucosidase isoform X2 [Diorhabda sublineata]
MMISIVVLLFSLSASQAQYQATWDSLDARPLPNWYDEAKIGIFLHWGVFSVPGFRSEWIWEQWARKDDDVVEYMKKNYAPNWNYQNFAKDFTAEFYNPDEWAEIFANSGAKYVVLTSKHHEGYTLWPSKYSFSWNAKDVGPGRDVLGELATAVRNKNLKFGVYHSYYEWFNELYLADKATNYTQTDFVDKKVNPELIELVNAYNPSLVWSDGDWEAPDTYWKSKEFLAWLYNESPVKDEVVVNDRWGTDIPCNHGGFFSCQDRYNPGTLQQHKWENAMTLDKTSWGFRRNAKLDDYMTTLELLTQLTSTVSCGGNILINIGPTKDGIIAPIFQQRLRDLGTWLSINGEAIYSTKPWTTQNDTLNANVWYTSKGSAVYAISLGWPEHNILNLGAAIGIFKDPATSVYLLGNGNEALKWTLNNDSVNINFPDKSTVKSEWAYVLKIIPSSKVNFI